MPRRPTHRDEFAGGRAAVDSISMPLGLAFGFAMVGVLLRIGSLITSIPTQEIYVLLCQLRYFVCTTARVTIENFWARRGRELSQILT